MRYYCCNNFDPTLRSSFNFHFVQDQTDDYLLQHHLVFGISKVLFFASLKKHEDNVAAVYAFYLY